MKNYSTTEETDAQYINTVNRSKLHEKNTWDKIFNDLSSIYNHIPSVGYENSFEENGKYYYKFWSQEEFLSYCDYAKQINHNRDIVWIQNAYPRCCYFLAVISIERGDFEAAAKFLRAGVELEPDNPMLLSETGLLLGSIGANTGDKTFFNQAIDCYEKAFNSRTFNTNSQKALALRGIGFILIELKEFENAKKFYEESLTWQESDNASNELEIIAKALNDTKAKVIRTGSNFNDANNIVSLKYFYENKTKLPSTLQNKIPSKYTYIWFKASNLLSQGFSQYRENDFFNYPLIEWDEPELKLCINQIVSYLKGFDPCHFIKVNNIESAKNLLLTFHFEPVIINKITNHENQALLEITFKHKVDNDEITMYFETLDIQFDTFLTNLQLDRFPAWQKETKKKRWKLW